MPDVLQLDGAAGVAAVLTCHDVSAAKVTGIDVLGGFDQELQFERTDQATVIGNLVVRDYPLLVRLHAERPAGR
jgi:hypothetical protein